MKIKIQPGTIQSEQIVNKLQEALPECEVTQKSDSHILIKKTPAIGANIFLKKKKIIISSAFPTTSRQVYFVLSILILGVIIPLIFYMIVYHGKMKKLEKEAALNIQTLLPSIT